MASGKAYLYFFSLLTLFCFTLESPSNAQIVDKVKERTMEKVEERAVEKSEEISDAIFEKLEGLFKKKKKVEVSEEKTEKKEEVEEPKTVKKNKIVKSS